MQTFFTDTFRQLSKTKKNILCILAQHVFSIPRRNHDIDLKKIQGWRSPLRYPLKYAPGWYPNYKRGSKVNEDAYMFIYVIHENEPSEVEIPFVTIKK